MANEFRFTDSDFQKIRGMIRDRAGINLGEQKKALVYNRLARRLRATSTTSFAHYIQMLEAGNGREWTEFTNALTTNLTCFFREPHHFPVLREHLRRLHRSEIRLWSCAASTGEEPYSMAMTALEALGGRASSAVKILATDIDSAVLEVAARGVYPAERVDHVPPYLRQKYFSRVAGEKDLYQVAPEVRNLVTFIPFNLTERSWPQKSRYDAIFCRNVLIYFDGSLQQHLVQRMTGLLREDGLFFSGHSEAFLGFECRLQAQGHTVYRMKQQQGAYL
ncbi:CheR family methyltransferase [Geomonas agri]|uniref:CheR family methyltransferase n=1 Tax=Geomonas agri TaxID=2873702 RepID=UPI001CD2B1B8|nr:protein-glutamate O-methyltransferase CheR [Geomonas agri]